MEDAPLTVVPLRRYRTWVSTTLVTVAVAGIVHVLLTNHRFQFDVVGTYLFDRTILAGVWLTLWLTAAAMGAGIVLGVLFALARMSPSRVVSGTAAAYIWFFRGTPVLVQLIFWFNLSAIFPVIRIGIPGGPAIFSGSANDLITPITAALLGLALNEGAYMAEIVRAGLLSVDRGQAEAAGSLGLTPWQTLRTITLPQAMRFILPPTGNETISMLKGTSLVSVLSIAELLYSAQIIYARNYQTIPLLIVASLWYLALTSVMSVGQFFIERHFGRGFSPRAASRPSRRRRHTAADESPVPPTTEAVLDGR